MGGSPRPFNSFFRWGWLLLLTAGCATTPQEKQAKDEAKDVSVIRLHTEPRDESAAGTRISLPRNSPVGITVEREPFADERDVVRADVINAVGGFAIRVQLTSHGRMALEQASVTRAGLRLAVFGQWTLDQEETTARWLAAPIMRRALREGVIAFTPDCDREEAVRFVRGLNNVAIKLENQPKPPKPKKPAPAPAEARKETAKEKRKREAKAREERASGAEDAINSFEKSRK